MIIRRAATTLALLLIGATVGAAWSTTTSAGAPPSTTAAVPHGWKTYTYGKAQVSVPSDWAVRTNYLCPGSKSTGTLYLGPPKGPPYASCPADVGETNSVTVTPLPAGAPDQSQCPIKLNGLRVYVGPCSTSDAAGIVLYDIPSLGVRAEGMGGSGENVTGPGSGTVVGQVLHTLRRR
jgi:hypothetical protein